MRLSREILTVAAVVTSAGSAQATPVYWSLFNIEGESAVTASYVTYGTRDDMLRDTNRTGIFDPNTGGFGRNVVDGGSDGRAFWSLFNIEGENSLTASYVTYSTLDDMLRDTNRTGIFDPNTGGFGRNVVGSGSDGRSYWSLFNIEGESSLTASYVTYDTLGDMLRDTNRTGIFDPNATGFGRNVVGSGSDGLTYWSLFNIEGESSLTASYVTYRTLDDMLRDTNRTGIFDPNATGFGRNVVGSGATIIPLPAAFWLLGTGIAALALAAPRRGARLPG